MSGHASFAAAISEHPLATHAVGESVGEILERLGPEPDLVVLFAGASFTGAMDDIVGAVRTLLRPKVLIGCTASTVVGASREVEDAGGLSLWAASGVDVTAHRLTRQGDSPPGETLLVLADPFSFPVDDLLERATKPVIGGLASAARGPGGNRLVLDGAVFTDGAVAVAFGTPLDTVVSQGCRPIGEPLIVTKGEGQLVLELAGRPALERVRAVLDGLSPEDLSLARKGLHVGRVVDESKPRFGPGDFLVRNVLGADTSIGAVAIGDDVEVGATLQLQVRDAQSADVELRHLLRRKAASAALVFTCSGRGTTLFGEPDHDASIVREELGPVPVAGMSCAGEIGPVGGRSYVHGFTASIALFGTGRSTSSQEGPG